MLISQNLEFFFLAKTVPNCLLLLFLLFFPAFFSSFLFTLRILPSGRKSLDKIIGKPWKGDVDQFQVCRPVYAPIFHQKWSVFFSDKLCQNAVVQNAQSFGKIYPRFISCLSEKLTDVQIDDVTSASMTTTPNADKSRV